MNPNTDIQHPVCLFDPPVKQKTLPVRKIKDSFWRTLITDSDFTKFEYFLNLLNRGFVFLNVQFYSFLDVFNIIFIKLDFGSPHMEDFLGLYPLIWAQTSGFSLTNSILTQTGVSGYTNAHTHTPLCCRNASKCRCSSQDKCETLPSALFEMVLRSQMLVRDCMFVTKCFTYKDQGPPSHTHKLYTCVWKDGQYVQNCS